MSDDVAAVSWLIVDAHNRILQELVNYLHTGLKASAERVQVVENRLSRLLTGAIGRVIACLLYTSPSPRDVEESRMPSSA